MQVVLKAKGLTQRGTREECLQRLIQASEASEVSKAGPTLAPHSDHVDNVNFDGVGPALAPTPTLGDSCVLIQSHPYNPRTEPAGAYAELTRDEMQVVLKTKVLTQRGTREVRVQRLIRASESSEVSEAEPTLPCNHVDDIGSDGVGAALAHTPTLGDSRVRILPHVLAQAHDHAAPQMVCKRCRTPKSARRSNSAKCRTSRRGWIAAGTPPVRHGRSRDSYSPRTETPEGYAELTRDEMQVVLKAKGLTQRGTREECVRRLIQASKVGEVSEAEPTLHSDHVDDIDSDGRISSFKWAMNQAIDLKKKFATMVEDARKKLDELEGHEFDVQANAEGGNEGIHHADHARAALAHTPTLGKSRVRILPHVLAQAHDHAAPEMVCKKCQTPKSGYRSSCAKCKSSRHGWIAAGTPPLRHDRSRHSYSPRTEPTGACTELTRDEMQVVLMAKGLTQRGTREKCVQRLNEASEVAEVSEAEPNLHFRHVEDSASDVFGDALAQTPTPTHAHTMYHVPIIGVPIATPSGSLAAATAAIPTATHSRDQNFAAV